MLTMRCELVYIAYSSPTMINKSKSSRMRKTGSVIYLHLLVLPVVMAFSCNLKSRYPGPLSPEESVKTFHFAGNFRAEIFAAEPDVIDPVAMEFDEQGNAYVVGMLDAYKPDST